MRRPTVPLPIVRLTTAPSESLLSPLRNALRLARNIRAAAYWKFVGAIGNCPAADPSPAPFIPWHCAQRSIYTRAPSSSTSLRNLRLGSALREILAPLRPSPPDPPIAVRAMPASRFRPRHSTARSQAGPARIPARRSWSASGAGPPRPWPSPSPLAPWQLGAITCDKPRRPRAASPAASFGKSPCAAPSPDSRSTVPRRNA